MVKMMHEMQPDRFETAMQTEDILQMTPIHRAALFDHVAVVDYLIQMVSTFICDLNESTYFIYSYSFYS